jgi:hypothetical protein
MATRFWKRLGIAVVLTAVLGVSTYAFAHDSWWMSRRPGPYVPGVNHEQMQNMHDTRDLTSLQRTYWCDDRNDRVTRYSWPTQRHAHQMGRTWHSRYGSWGGHPRGRMGHAWHSRLAAWGGHPMGRGHYR